MNVMVRRLYNAGLVPKTSMLGGVLDVVPYDIGPDSSGQVTQAVQVILEGRAGIHRTYLRDCEHGTRNVSLVNVGRLANAFEVTLSELFGGIE